MHCICKQAALYNLQSLIPVLLSRGANPEVKSARGDVTPLHLACGAGNTAIVELLLRHGCAIEVADCFGSLPADHALRNGFHELATMLWERALADREFNSTEGESIRRVEDQSRKHELKEMEKFRLQAAFSSLSLKDKLVLNMLVKQRLQKPPKPKTGAGRMSQTIIKVEDESENGMSDSDDTAKIIDITELGSPKHADDNEPSDDEVEAEADELSTAISVSDKESLDIAMRLMNDGVSYTISQRIKLSIITTCCLYFLPTYTKGT